MLLAACGDEAPQEPAPRAVDTEALASAEVVAAVLDECHRPLLGALDRIAANVRLPDGSTVRLFAQLPDKLRTASDTERFLLVGDTVLALDDGTSSTPPPAAAERVRRLRTLLDAATLGPLHRASGCRRLGPAEFELEQPAGPPWRLRLRPGTLLPERLTGPGGDVGLLAYLRTTTTWMCKRAELDGLGICELHFELADLDWDADFFAVPSTAKRPATDRAKMQMPVTPGAEPRSPVPILVEGKALQWVVFPDPGTWPERAAAYGPVHAEVARQDQQIAGFPLLFADGERRMMGLPFRQRPQGAALVAPKEWTIRSIPASRWLVVYPPDGDLTARLATGEKLLQAELARQDLRATGPIAAQPFLHLHEGEPAADKLREPIVRVSVPVQ